MDIWKWVQEAEAEARRTGNTRLAELIDRLPTVVTEDAHAQVDALFPEALVLARQAKSPWLEVFFRHWNLQSRIFHRSEPGEWLSESISLLEFAHREDTRECPQSVCVTQDVAGCYGRADGPGWASERRAVVSETLARIDPTWPCFTCLSTEYFLGLMDEERFEEALAWLEKQDAALVAAGQAHKRRYLLSERADVLLALGRLPEALAVAEEAEAQSTSDHNRVEGRILRARVLARLGRTDEALEALPSLSVVRSTPSHYESWADALVQLMKAGAVHNDANLERTLLELGGRLASTGAIRRAFRLEVQRAEAALERGQPRSALHACARLEALLPRLRKPLGADETLRRLRAKAESLTPERPPELPESAAALLEKAEEDAEDVLQLLDAARARWPGERATLVRAQAKALEQLGRGEEAEVALRSLLDADAHPTPDVVGELGMNLLERRRFTELRALVDSVLATAGDTPLRVEAYRLRARAALATGEKAAAKAALRAMLELDPELRGTTLTLAALERDTGEREQALARLDAAVARWPEPGPHDWDRMLVATLLGRWDVVRASAARLEFKLSGDSGPVEEEWEACRLRYTEPDGTFTEVWARRTGPVTARVLSIAMPGAPQHLGDAVVFDATPLNEGPAEGEEEEDHSWLYPVVEVLRPGRYSVFALDGVGPGQEVIERMQETLAASGARLSVRTSETYRLMTPEEEEVPGFYALLAVPPEVDLGAVEAGLRQCTEGLPYPLLWPTLLEKLGREQEAEAQRAVAEQWEISL
jgi:tetratricopeptide (TPR) repeat protein